MQEKIANDLLTLFNRLLIAHSLAPRRRRVVRARRSRARMSTGGFVLTTIFRPERPASICCSAVIASEKPGVFVATGSLALGPRAYSHGCSGTTGFSGTLG